MFDERDVARGVDVACAHVVAAIATLVAGVAEEDAGQRAREKLVRCRGCQVGVAEAAEDVQLVVAWRDAEEELVRRDGARGAAGTSIDEVRRRVQGLGPQRQRSCTVY